MPYCENSVPFATCSLLQLFTVICLLLCGICISEEKNKGEEGTCRSDAFTKQAEKPKKNINYPFFQ